MATDGRHLVMSYARGAAWLLVLYLLWCFGPAGYSAIRYRWVVYDSVESAGVSRQGPDELHQVLLWKADELAIPIKPEDIAVVHDPVTQTITATYAYSHPVKVFGWVAHLHMHGESSAASYTSK